jgi:hypothetical protein
VRLNWTTIAALSSAIAASIIIAFAISKRTNNALPDPNYYAHAHSLPFDLRDESSRAAFDKFVHRTDVNYGLQPLDCERGNEYYRGEISPGLGDSEFAAVELHISGNTARVIRRELGRQPLGKSIDWHVVSSEKIGMQSAQLVRDAAASLLLSGASPAGPAGPVDSSEWIADMCWHGKYHFFQRYAPGAISPDHEFIAFTRRLLALGNKVDKRAEPSSKDSAKDCPKAG